MLLLISAQVGASAYYGREDVNNFIDKMVNEHNYDRGQLETLIKNVEKQESVLKAIQTPAERKLKWFEYRRIFLKDKRIDGGVEFWNQNEEILNKAETQYGVPPEIIVAIIGVETYYGGNTGKNPVLDSLVTLGFDYPRRSKFFLSELEHFLLLTREEGFDPTQITGSYAGAMGLGQFISSSYRNYTVDQDQDGKRDLWGSKEDIIGSVANYFKVHGWRESHAITSPAKFTGDPNTIDDSNTLKPKHTYSKFNKQGFVADMPIGQNEQVSLFVLDTENDKQYWLGQHNFYVITRYNHSHMYAMAVYQLSEEIKQRRESSTEVKQ
ncbi:MAG: lytic murein transglycosylase B [Pseudomonadota bacterium]